MSCKLLGFIVAALLALPAYAEKKCELQQYAQLPVNMSGTRPVIAGTINGSPAQFLADSGAAFSMISREAAEKYQLKVGPLPPQINVRGVGGSASVGLTKVKNFSLVGFRGGNIYNNVEFMVGGAGFGGEAIGLIGQNVIGHADTEYDFANGYIRLFRAKDCSGRLLAYWHGTADVAEMEIEPISPIAPHMIGTAKINGKKIKVVFDTGAWRSVLTLRAAARAGIKPEDDNVTSAGLSRGIGKQTMETWLARFDTLDIGGEVIKNARLRISDIEVANGSDMLLGADFFLSHRIYVAAAQKKIYFTYNGGAVFDLRPTYTGNVKAAAPAATATENAAGAAVSGTAAVAAGRDNSADAAEFRRRGAASLGRQDYPSAIAAFDQAIKLDASDPENFYQRALAHMQNQQSGLAMSDLDETLKLKPDHNAALMMRGTSRLLMNNEVGARADFDTAVSLAPNDTSLPIAIATTFLGTGRYGEAVTRLDTWIAANPKSDRLVIALSVRCLARAMDGKELDTALADCNTALKKGQKNSDALSGRAFVYLRRGDFDKSIADYKASLKLQPKQAWTLYGLGLAELRKGMRAEGDRDIQAAIAISPSVASTYKRIGLTP